VKRRETVTHKTPVKCPGDGCTGCGAWECVFFENLQPVHFTSADVEFVFTDDGKKPH
jgi:hypothetical protein